MNTFSLAVCSYSERLHIQLFILFDQKIGTKIFPNTLCNIYSRTGDIITITGEAFSDASTVDIGGFTCLIQGMRFFKIDSKSYFTPYNTKIIVIFY